MRKSFAVIFFLAVVGLAGNLQAVPILQVGAPGASGEGTYADYQEVLPIQSGGDDTAITSGSTLYVGGILEKKIAQLGGRYVSGRIKGKNWSSFHMPTAFNGHGAILVASVPDGTLTTALASLEINGSSAFYSSATKSYFSNSHDPLKPGISDFLFFDIGNFAKSVAVADFAKETSGSTLGEVKTLTLSGMGNLDWIHFDVMALATDSSGRTKVATNPGSHDLSWEKGISVSAPLLVPEPATLLLLGLGLVGLYGYWLRKRTKKNTLCRRS